MQDTPKLSVWKPTETMYDSGGLQFFNEDERFISIAELKVFLALDGKITRDNLEEVLRK